MAGWYIEKGPESDVVVSSRVRLARNFKEYPFPFKMNAEQAKQVLAKTRDAVICDNGLGREILFINIQNMNSVDKQALVERHLISPDITESKIDSGVLLSMDEKISIMVNEEDHLRIQCLFPGMQMDAAWEMCSSIERLLEKSIDFAYDDRYGYLTCCPTNIGTGVRASAMLHLPALVMTGYIRGILDACSKLGIAVRGLYGENSEASGNMFQFSNQVTLGQTEEETIANIKNVLQQIIEQERGLRTGLYKQGPERFEDKVMRSFGILSNARIITSEESLKLLSDVRLGIYMGIINNINIETLNEVMLLIKPACLQKTVDKQLSPDERDIERAELIRSKLNP